MAKDEIEKKKELLKKSFSFLFNWIRELLSKRTLLFKVRRKKKMKMCSRGSDGRTRTHTHTHRQSEYENSVTIFDCPMRIYSRGIMSRIQRNTASVHIEWKLNQLLDSLAFLFFLYSAIARFFFYYSWISKNSSLGDSLTFRIFHLI